MSDRCLVLGASGFLGAALVRRLVADGRAVRALVRDAAAPRLLGISSDVEVVAAPEWTDAALAAALAGGFGEVVFHLAGGGVDPSRRDPAALVDANVRLTARVASAVPSDARLVYVGSCVEHGRVPEGRRVREDDPARPVEAYGATKAAGAVVGRALAEARGARFVHARVFGVYGPDEPAYRLVPSLAAALRRGETIGLTPGAQRRDFLHVDDVAQALARLGASPLADDVYNVCSGVPTSVAEVARAVAAALGAPADRLDFGARPYRPGESMWMVGDPGRLVRDTGFSPARNLSEGIQQVVDALS